jgi:TolA-binding protein
MKIAVAMMVMACGVALAQEAAKPAETRVAKPSTPPARLPGLDEVLGLSKPEEGKGDVPTRESTALEEALAAEPIGDQIEQAVKLMGDAAARVQGAKDVGIETQRVQEEILQKLDKIIEDAKRQQQQQQEQQQQQQQQQQSQDQQQQSPEQQQQQQERARQQAEERRRQEGNASGDKTGLDGPTNPGGTLKPTLAGSAAWGNLPARERAALLQGFGDTFSSMYRRMTEAYYRRLAEEPKRE